MESQCVCMEAGLDRSLCIVWVARNTFVRCALSDTDGHLPKGVLGKYKANITLFWKL